MLFRSPEGSAIEELVKRLPGAEVDDEGKITINGKQVTKILVDGKEFMTGDTKTAMKNLPTSIVNRVRAYDQKSDSLALPASKTATRRLCSISASNQA